MGGRAGGAGQGACRLTAPGCSGVVVQSPRAAMPPVCPAAPRMQRGFPAPRGRPSWDEDRVRAEARRMESLGPPAVIPRPRISQEDCMRATRIIADLRVADVEEAKSFYI